jgi:hypothetical protein
MPTDGGMALRLASLRETERDYAPPDTPVKALRGNTSFEGYNPAGGPIRARNRGAGRL